jgi:hypothetical protein
LDNWPTIKMVFDGLLDYDDTNITPRLAEICLRLAMMRQFTFKLPGSNFKMAAGQGR